MSNIKIAHSIKNRCMVLRMLESMPEALAGMPENIRKIKDLREYQKRAMAIAVKLLERCN